MGIRQNKKKLLGILENRHIAPVFQPIVSLDSGVVWGYEALSRISNEEFNMDIESMFSLADIMDKAWELEALCRTKALENFADSKCLKNLFVNVNPNIMHDEKFKEGFTQEKLEKFGLSPDKIIFEITERVAVAKKQSFFDAVEHYKKQNYRIAIDDVGSGFSGLNEIVDIKPQFIKLDLNLIRNIDKDEVKKLLCKAMTDFCKGAGIKLIAEGIESEEELKELIALGVDFGQGYFLGYPDNEIKEISVDKANLIKKYYSKKLIENVQTSVYPKISRICNHSYTFSPDEKLEYIHSIMTENPTITEFVVIEDNKVIGFMSKADLFSVMGGRYGYSLNAKKNLRDIINKEFLCVNCDMTVNQVSKLAMQRPYEKLYNPIVVEKKGEYFGVVTIKDLLETCTKADVEKAMHSNPLTGLPGNLLIEKEIQDRIFGEKPYCITYYDIDNFKAYNDCYGFENGDLMLELLADILKSSATKKEFIGHIGGDDFIVIADYEEGKPYCEKIVEEFTRKVITLYNDEDVINGCIISKNRNGVTDKFPLAGVSIAGVTSKGKNYESVAEFSLQIAKLKKEAKKCIGSSICFQ